MKRVRCRGDCGRWWYYDGSRKPGNLRGGGRPREWCSDCLAWHTRDRKRADAPNLMAPGKLSVSIECLTVDSATQERGQ